MSGGEISSSDSALGVPVLVLVIVETGGARCRTPARCVMTASFRARSGAIS